MYTFSTTILSSQSQVHRNLADLIRWADHILMHGEQAVNKENAHEIIKSLEDAVRVRSFYGLRLLAKGPSNTFHGSQNQPVHPCFIWIAESRRNIRRASVYWSMCIHHRDFASTLWGIFLVLLGLLAKELEQHINRYEFVLHCTYLDSYCTWYFVIKFFHFYLIIRSCFDYQLRSWKEMHYHCQWKPEIAQPLQKGLFN